MRNTFSILLFLFLGIGSSLSQHFPTNFPANLQQFPFFHSQYISSHNIQGIETEVMYKSPMKTLEYSKEKISIKFNKEGFPVYKLMVSSLGDSTEYWYESKGDILIYERIKTSYRDVERNYVYDEKGNILRNTETDKKTGLIVAEEEFKYVYSYKDQYKKYWINDEGLSYKYSIIKLNQNNKIIEERGRYIVGTSKHAKYYVYDDQSRLIDYASNIRESTRREQKYKIHYDELNRVVEMNEFKDGAYIHHHEFLYENNLLTAILEKNIRTQKIKIIKFKTEKVSPF